MKVVLFCGGQGMRLRGYSDEIPKPMVPLGYRPILWHVMKYYAHFGHKDFILCLGYQADVIKRFFLEYQEEVSNDFVLHGSAQNVELLDSDIGDWTITFVDTGIHTSIGERLRRVRDHVAGEQLFLANYADGVVDLDHNAYIESFLASDSIAGLIAVKPPQSYHVLHMDEMSRVSDIEPMGESDIWLNGGFFALRQEIFDYIKPGEELVMEPFHRLMAERRLYAHRFTGFFAPMDTFKDKNRLDSMYEQGAAPWVLWKENRSP